SRNLQRHTSGCLQRRSAPAFDGRSSEKPPYPIVKEDSNDRSSYNYEDTAERTVDQRPLFRGDDVDPLFIYVSPALFRIDLLVQVGERLSVRCIAFCCFDSRSRLIAVPTARRNLFLSVQLTFKGVVFHPKRGRGRNSVLLRAPQLQLFLVQCRPL